VFPKGKNAQWLSQMCHKRDRWSAKLVQKRKKHEMQQATTNLLASLVDFHEMSKEMYQIYAESRYFRKPRPSSLFLFMSRAGGKT